MTADGAHDTESVAEVADPVVAAVRSCLCRLGGEVLAVDLQSAREFVVVEDLTVVPGAPSHVLGVMNLRGRIVPVVDIRPLLGLASAVALGRGCHALVVQAGVGDLAIVVEAVLGLESLCPSASGDEATAEAARFRARWFRPDGAAVSLLDVPPMAEALRARPAARVKEDPA